MSTKPTFSAINDLNPADSIFPETLGLAASNKRLQGRNVLVVGAGQRNVVDQTPPIGNGRAISTIFAREGASVVCLDINKEAAEATVAQIKSEGGNAIPLVFDVRDADAIASVVDDARNKLGGKLDALVLVVGVSRHMPLMKMTKDGWDHDFSINVRSHMLFAQRAVQVMEPGGSIVILSSMASQRAWASNPAYESSKAAQLALARAIARAGEEKGIRANAIAPGYIDTPMGRDASRNSKGRAAKVPWGRQGTGWEVAYLALFLTSHESSYVNAFTVNMDGGGMIGLAGRDRNDASTRAKAKL